MHIKACSPFKLKCSFKIATMLTFTKLLSYFYCCCCQLNISVNYLRRGIPIKKMLLSDYLKKVCRAFSWLATGVRGPSQLGVIPPHEQVVLTVDKSRLSKWWGINQEVLFLQSFSFSFCLEFLPCCPLIMDSELK